MQSRLRALFLAAILLFQPSIVALRASDLDWPAMADKLVERLALDSGQAVLIAVKGDRFAALAELLRERVRAAGARDLGAHDVAGSQLSDSELKGLLEPADVLVIFPGPLPTDGAYRVMQDILREGRKRTIHFHWEGAMPVEEGGPIPEAAVIDQTYQNALLKTDYDALKRRLNEFETALRAGDVHVTTPKGTDIRFRIGDRVVTRQDGDASAQRAAEGRVLIDREVELPAGAIRVAPLEASVNGTIVLAPTYWNGKRIEKLTLRIQSGRVAGIEALDNKGQPDADGLAAVEAEMAAGGDAARWFREFALGFNPLLAIPEQQQWIPYYGYGAGVVRLSLGDNSELGGEVRGPYVRWNLFANASVAIGDQEWVSAGRLVR